MNLDLGGPEWPGHIYVLAGLAGILLLCRAAWKWGGRARTVVSSATGLLAWCVLAIAPWAGDEYVCWVGFQFQAVLPGCDWHPHSPPAGGLGLFVWLVLGSARLSVSFGGPLALVIAVTRMAWVRARNVWAGRE